jgi:hypothetical protein
LARQTIFLGSAPNDGTGDKKRIAGEKINANFAELYGLVLGLQGEWTPVLRASGTASGVGTMTGIWSRAGGVAFIQCDIRLTAAPTASGIVTITGLPFVARQPAALGVVSFSGVADDGVLSASVHAAVIELTKGPPNGVAPSLVGADLAYNATLSLSGSFGVPL